MQRDQAIAGEQQQHPNVYAPFTIDEFDGIPLDTSVLDLCLRWPAPVVAPIPPGHPVPPNAQFTKAPVLVLSGDLDSLTPALQYSPGETLEFYEQIKQASPRERVVFLVGPPTYLSLTWPGEVIAEDASSGQWGETVKRFLAAA